MQNCRELNNNWAEVKGKQALGERHVGHLQPLGLALGAWASVAVGARLSWPCLAGIHEEEGQDSGALLT